MINPPELRLRHQPTGETEMINHFEKLARHQREQQKGKQIAALVMVLIGVTMMTAGAAMTMAFILTLVETS